MGDEKLHLQLITMFLEDFEKDFPLSIKSQESEETTSLLKKIHNLKGTAGAIGAVLLSESLTSFHDSLKMTGKTSIRNHVSDCRTSFVDFKKYMEKSYAIHS